MKYPAFNFGFEKNEEDWDFGFLTMDLMFFFFLLPEKAFDYDEGVMLWDKYKLQQLAHAFLGGKATLDREQANLFLDGTDAICRMLLTGDKRLKEEIFYKVQLKASRFLTLNEFEAYYLHHATKLLNKVKEFCGQNEEFMSFYQNLFKRGRDNFSYAEWKKGLKIS
nr:hypothetical protein [Mucilaginibacter sp. L294]